MKRIAIMALVVLSLAGCKSEYEECMDVPVTSDHSVEYYMQIAEDCEQYQ